jgi:hypothetical protein
VNATETLSRIITGACIALPALWVLQMLAAKVFPRRRVVPLPQPPEDALDASVSCHPARYRTVMRGPVPHDGEPLSTGEAVALAALLYSFRHEDAPEHNYGADR